MARRNRPAKTEPAKYDPAVWNPLDADFEKRKSVRKAYEAQRRAKAAAEARHARIYRLLARLGDGTVSQPVQHLGELVVPPIVWASDLLALARAWRRYPGLYDHGLVPRILVHKDEASLAYDLARDLFEFACRDPSLEDMTRYISDAVVRLTNNRRDGLSTSFLDLSAGLATYFHNLAFWFDRTGGDIWYHAGVQDLVVTKVLAERRGTFRSNTAETPDPSLREPNPKRGRLGLIDPDFELTARSRACRSALAATRDGFGPALDWLEALDFECEQLHIGSERHDDDGDYRAAIDIASQVCAWAGHEPPASPAPCTRISLRSARKYVSECRQLFMDRSRAEYWVWRQATSGCTGADYFIKWHLEQMEAVWAVTRNQVPEASGVLAVVNAVHHEFTCLHTLWAVPHHARPDYLPVAAYLAENASDVLPSPYPVPSGVVRFARLDAWIEALRTSVKKVVPKPARRKTGRKPLPNPEADRRLADRYRASDRSLKDFAPTEGLTVEALTQAIDRDRKRRAATGSSHTRRK